MVSGHPVDDDPPALDVVRSEMPECQLLLVQVPYRPLLIDMCLLMWQADTSLTVGVILEELDINHVQHRIPGLDSDASWRRYALRDPYRSTSRNIARRL